MVLGSIDEGSLKVPDLGQVGPSRASTIVRASSLHGEEKGAVKLAAKAANASQHRVISMEKFCVIHRDWGMVDVGRKRMDEAVTIGLLRDPCSASASMHTNGRGPTTYLVANVPFGAQRCPFQCATSRGGCESGRRSDASQWPC